MKKAYHWRASFEVLKLRPTNQRLDGASTPVQRTCASGLSGRGCTLSCKDDAPGKGVGSGMEGTLGEEVGKGIRRRESTLLEAKGRGKKVNKSWERGSI